MNLKIKTKPSEEIEEAAAGIVENDKEKKKQKQIAHDHNFYTVKLKDGKLEDITIDKETLVDKFIELGFCRFDTDDDKFLMVQLKDNTIKRVSPTFICDAFIDWVVALKDYHKIIPQAEMDIEVIISGRYIKKKLYRSLETYFNDVIYKRARAPKKIQIQKDTIGSKFFFFKNGFVEITKEGHKLHDYKKLTNQVWETSILSNTFEYTEVKGNFEKFFENITGKDEARKKSLMSICGYLLHSFYDYKTFLILLTDAGMTENGEPNGRTGKSLLLKALGKMLNVDDNQSGYIEIDGKTFKSQEDRKYQRADIDTSLIHINDIFSWFSIETLFTDITEGIIVRQMYEKPFRIYSKLAMSSNKTIKLEGVSSRDRVVVYEIENHYSDLFNPEMEFKEWFFRDWKTEEWNKFYSFIVRCCTLFFQEGILRPKEINYSQRIIAEHTKPEFITWFEYSWKIIQKEMEETKSHIERSKKFMYLNFIEEYIDFKRDVKFTQRKMTKWIKMILEWKEIPYEERRSSDDIFFFINPNIEYIPNKEIEEPAFMKETPIPKQEKMNFTQPQPDPEPVEAPELAEVETNFPDESPDID